MPDPKPLEAALTYRNEDVIARFLKLYDIPKEEAEALLQETIKLLWVLDVEPTVRVFPEMTMLDEMWHNFFLFSLDYTEFCETYLNRFIHHQPATLASAKAYADAEAADPDAARAADIEAYERQLETVADLLGEETLVTWHVEHRNRYTKAFFAERRKVPFTLSPIQIDLTTGE